ncbi:hypothetical protein ECC02_010878 [Trypanosoma cruzi]|uniref:Uncharacterized protein n=1 Tax=Trypanosoma cruzi TaxID=5693 RepID=A0A7J6XPJ7_TRYCR|nr:hypothetical protein ECC02_010878 [Trypanosoma cruzi]
MSQCCGRASANTTTEDRITVWLTRIRTPDDSADSAPPTNCSAAPSRNVHPMSVMLMGRCSGILSKENVSAAPTPLNVTPKKQCCVFHMFSVRLVSVWFTTQLVSPSTALSGKGGTTAWGTSKGRQDAPCHPSLQLHKHKLRSTDSVPGMWHAASSLHVPHLNTITSSGNRPSYDTSSPPCRLHPTTNRAGDVTTMLDGKKLAKETLESN